MSEFEVSVHTSPGPTCGTFSRLWLSLIGSQGETPPLSVNEGERRLLPGSVCPVRVRVNGPLGRLVLVRLRLEARPGFPALDWHCSRVEVRGLADGQEGAESQTQVFLCDRWLQTADEDVDLRTGKCKITLIIIIIVVVINSIAVVIGLLCLWRNAIDGALQCVDLNSVSELEPNLRYTRKSPTADTTYLKGFSSRAEAWTSFSELETVFSHSGHQNSIARFVQAHWKDDWYFGHQCLNGCNPLMLRQIHLVPPNLSVTTDLLRPFLPEGSSLQLELQSGRIYLLDYEVLDGIPANVVNGKQTYLSAPLCLLHLNQQDQLVPIAIQLQQNPGPQNPVFLPSDAASDWLLAKIWVRGADSQCHQLVSHYLKSHLMGELCCVATLRQLPQVHPLHQLLMPHVKTLLQINLQARGSLLAAGGVFDQAMGSGLKTIPVLLSRASARITYRSLCVPDDLKDRGLDNLPQSYYAQDALRIWEVLHSFVVSWLQLYYSKDDDVQLDSELQGWITDINTHGFTHNSGFPQSFNTRAEVSKFVTMIIFSCSALHAAINFSQLDFALWMPNCPMAMLRPPPQVKGSVTEDDILTFLPDVSSTCRILMSLTMLSQPAVDFVPLCCYKEAIFADGAHRRLVEEVQAQLAAISEDIAERNSQLEMPYPYLCPTHIENSVAI
uniref:Hydroperoxide isomerase ALOXE3-like n=1 Tax=Stegastes partitus TaxID=144197 RepID=A0A3B5AMP0_9TELE